MFNPCLNLVPIPKRKLRIRHSTAILPERRPRETASEFRENLSDVAELLGVSLFELKERILELSERES
jgi:hypothetical protein